jgi:PAP2 superfamily
VQRLFLSHPLIIQFWNLYYDSLHFPVLVTLLIWLFVWHRPGYRRVRTTLVLLTGGCLLIQLMPVAPPRMLPEAGMTDTAIKYGQSVYGTTAGFNPDQLSAMPSVHVAWALLVAVAVIAVSASRWRWLSLGYPVMTTLAVVVTANHFWADGIVAGAVLVVALAIQSGTRWLWGRHVAAGLSRGPGAPRARVTAGAGLGGASAGSRNGPAAASDPGAGSA